MSVWKMTGLFASDRDGWSETYYFLLPDDNVSTGFTESHAWVAVRRQVLGGGAIISATRWSNTAVKRSGYKFLVGANGTASTTDTTAGTLVLADQPSACVLMPFSSINNVKRFVSISGVPDDWIIRDSAAGFVGLSDRGTRAINRYYNWLLSDSNPFQLRVRAPAPGNPLKPILTITESADFFYQISCTGHGFVLGQRIAFTAVKGRNVGPLTGVKKVRTVIDANTFTVTVGPSQYLGDISYLGGGFVQADTPTYTRALGTLTSYIISTRKRGRPFAARRGRRSVRR
jgi:hypothetical protein